MRAPAQGEIHRLKPVPLSHPGEHALILLGWVDLPRLPFHAHQDIPLMHVPPSVRAWPTYLWLFLPILILFVVIHVGLGFSGFYGQDSHAYLAYSKRILAYGAGGELPGSFFWPVNFPLAGAALSLMTQKSLPLVSLISFLALLAMFRQAVMTHFKADGLSATLFTLMTLASAPVLLRASQLGMSDMLAITLSFAAWLKAQRVLEQVRARDVLLAACLAGFAVGTRLASAVLLIIPGFIVLRVLIQRKRGSLLFFAGLVFLLGLLPSVWFTGGMETLSRHGGAHHVSIWHWFQADFPHHPDGHLRYNQINIIHALSPFFRPDYCLLLPLLLLLSGPKEFALKISRHAWWTAVIYLLFIAGLEMQNPRFLLPALPFLLLPLYASWSRFFEAFAKSLWRGIFVLFWLAFSLFVFWKLMTPMLERSRLEASIAAELHRLPDEPIYLFAVDVAMPTYGVTHHLINLWKEPIDHFKRDGFALFNEARFAKQWAGKLPMQNWERLKSTHDLQALHDFGQGWVLYKIGDTLPQ